MKLKDIKVIEGIIQLKTGTRIGANLENIEIGGNDNPIVRNPLTNEVYIPGSSLKGKMRMSMEWLTGKIEKSGNVHNCLEKDCPICRVFGRSADSNNSLGFGPTRIIVRDMYLEENSRNELLELRNNYGRDSEWKYENSINRLSSKANPRNLERIPAGTKFKFSSIYKIFDIDDNGKIDEDNFEKIVLKALKMLVLEGIGGGVSRGSGQIEFVELFVNNESYLEKLNNLNIK